MSEFVKCYLGPYINLNHVEVFYTKKDFYDGYFVACDLINNYNDEEREAVCYYISNEYKTREEAQNHLDKLMRSMQKRKDPDSGKLRSNGKAYS